MNRLILGLILLMSSHAWAAGGDVRCATDMARQLEPYSNGVVINDENGNELTGFDNGRFGEGLPTYLSLVMQTEKEKYYYTEFCDICADILVCDLETGKIRGLVSGHSASCGDLPKVPHTFSVCD